VSKKQQLPSKKTNVSKTLQLPNSIRNSMRETDAQREHSAMLRCRVGAALKRKMSGAALKHKT
jgi:hypothetical protein